jgi:hypothetical protein
MRNYLKVGQVPFDKLNEIGISKEAFLDLPRKAIDRILTGRTSPLMKMRMIDNNGRGFTFPAKFSFVQDELGKSNLMIHPAMKEVDNRFKFDSKELEMLKDMKVIVKTIDRGNGKEKCYCQLDPETNTVMTTRINDIRVPEAIGDVSVGGTQRERMRNGEAVEVEIGGEKVVAGVDLNDQTGFKVLKGDMGNWMQKKLIEWDRITLGATGFWQTSENGWEYQQGIDKNKSKQVEESKEEKRGMNADIEETQETARGMRMKYSR